nr:immunoglobulin light chain junction region [Macaca mulatta]MOV65798.1 immunoglobulin light chain junction region [Macaca mulatta]MOV65844.1 immunoglobulin light chain junction region [Macaca mulatta]MOV65877.1 immunoglobulin light chain junction region [Macaca mulatta]MOV65884.1 immunoglobulin light chain junction region [Macaca mulatta]
DYFCQVFDSSVVFF